MRWIWSPMSPLSSASACPPARLPVLLVRVPARAPVPARAGGLWRRASPVAPCRLPLSWLPSSTSTSTASAIAARIESSSCIGRTARRMSDGCGARAVSRRRARLRLDRGLRFCAGRGGGAFFGVGLRAPGLSLAEAAMRAAIAARASSRASGLADGCGGGFADRISAARPTRRAAAARGSGLAASPAEVAAAVPLRRVGLRRGSTSQSGLCRGSGSGSVRPGGRPRRLRLLRRCGRVGLRLRAPLRFRRSSSRGGRADS